MLFFTLVPPGSINNSLNSSIVSGSAKNESTVIAAVNPDSVKIRIISSWNAPSVKAPPCSISRLTPAYCAEAAAAVAEAINPNGLRVRISVGGFCLYSK